MGDLPFVNTRAQAEDMLRTLPRFSGGTNVGESSLEAVQAALAKRYRPRAVTVLVVLTDERPLQTRRLTAAQIAQALVRKEVICFVAAPDLPAYRRWAADNGGKWYEIKPSMDTAALLAYLRSLVRDLPRVARAVHDIGGGSVRQYLDREGGTDTD